VDRPSRIEIERSIEAVLLGLAVGMVIALLDRRRTGPGR
jgi:hypothetical protein